MCRKTDARQISSAGEQKRKRAAVLNIFISFSNHNNLNHRSRGLLLQSRIHSAVLLLRVHGRGEYKPTLTGPTMVCGVRSKLVVYGDEAPRASTSRLDHFFMYT